MPKCILSAEVQATQLAAAWAQHLGLPAGNLWEPAMVRYILKEWTRLGGDAQALAFVRAITAHRLGLELA